MTEPSELAEQLAGLQATVHPVAQRFEAAGYRLYLVGGIVRDLRLGRPSGFDIDFTTDARPADIKRLVAPLSDAVWTQGERFGTIGASINGDSLEITTHRAERYDPDSRKPVVSFGDELNEDLSRRDFTINAMAIEVPGNQLHDPYGGAVDLDARMLRTPLSPEISFTDDPLRMLRAARFVSRFDLTVDPDVMDATVALASRIEIVSVERVADELERLLAVADPQAGFEFLRSTGLLSLAVLGTSDAMADDDQQLACRLAAAGSPGDSSGTNSSGTNSSGNDGNLVRRAGLLWNTDVKAVLARLKYSNHDQRVTILLVGGVRNWIDSEYSSLADGRRLMNRVESVDGPRGLATNLVELSSDPVVTAGAHRLLNVLDELEASDDLGPYQSPLTGAHIMESLAVEPGPVVGAAQKYLRAYRLDHGSFDADTAVDLLRTWQESLDERSP